MAQSLLQQITSHLPRLERLLLIVLVLGIASTFVSSVGSLIVNVSIAGLAMTFFLYACKPLERGITASDESAFRDAVARGVVPRVLWISCAVSAMGVLFFLLRMNRESSERMLLIGCVSILAALLALGILRIGGTRHLNAVEPVLLRAVPLLLIDCYLLFGQRLLFN
ncbi:MAG TPA: hypothetical protein VIH22_06900 [Cyclobacteriaceae bacterium]